MVWSPLTAKPEALGTSLHLTYMGISHGHMHPFYLGLSSPLLGFTSYTERGRESTGTGLV